MASNTKQRANEARELKDNGAFQSIISDIRANAHGLFFDPSSSIEDLARAQNMVKAIETFLSAIDGRLNAEMVEDKAKAKHRE